MWWAKTVPSPLTAANLVPYPLDPRTNTSGLEVTTGAASTSRYGWSSGKSSARNAISIANSCGKSGTASGWVPRSANAVRPSVPGARPNPRSMRPGWSASRVRNTSATFNGA